MPPHPMLLFSYQGLSANSCCWLSGWEFIIHLAKGGQSKADRARQSNCEREREKERERKIARGEK